MGIQETDELDFKVARIESVIQEIEDETTLPNGKRVRYTDHKIPVRNMILTVYKPKFDPRTKIMTEDPVTKNIPVPFRTDDNSFTRDERITSEEVLRAVMATPVYGRGDIKLIPISKEDLDREKKERRDANYQRQLADAKRQLAGREWTGIPMQKGQEVGVTDAPVLGFPA